MCVCPLSPYSIDNSKDNCNRGYVLKVGFPIIFLVDGGWTNFTVWSPCSKSCSGGKKFRYRYCTNPAPRYGGLKCDGNSYEEKECNFQICPGKQFFLYEDSLI